MPLILAQLRRFSLYTVTQLSGPDVTFMMQKCFSYLVHGLTRCCSQVVDNGKALQ